jgi:hypothetical protein
MVLGDVTDVNQGALEPVAIRPFAAGTARPRGGDLRWQLFPTFLHRILAGRPILLVAPGLEVSLGLPG